MNTQMMEAAREAPQMMGSMMGNVGQLMAHPMSTGAMLAAGGYAAGKGALFGLLRNPLVVLAAGVAAGYLLFRYQKEIVETATKLTGMGRDFIAHQKENLDDLIAETKSPAATSADPASAATSAPAASQE
ncbi:hypothetical protein [Sulfuricystis multivorans]|uniref:hypothetical protein n=1 Tax=Sulfuricystis multivorans TaxID=2211108 RepID=UPI0024DF3750|nr:hypothetical protein [Sulfuricystis multivorans]